MVLLEIQRATNLTVVDFSYVLFVVSVLDVSNKFFMMRMNEIGFILQGHH